MDTPRWLTPWEQEIWQAYLHTNLLFMRDLDRQLRRDSGLSHTAYALLVRLADLPAGSARITELAGELDHSQSRTSHAVARLERAGLVRREVDADDRRVVHVVISAAGRAALQAAAPGHVRRVREMLFDPLDAERLTVLKEVLDGLLERLDDHDRGGPAVTSGGGPAG